ncbi:MAG TPA: hypothetical protein VGR18_08085 [Rubrobacter sp.]|nr:hypothetical protein [Rubrobacter sp.]
MSSRQDGRAAEEQGGLQPRYRRAFGCVTWLYMAMLTFLAANFFISLPFRYFGGEAVYNYVPPTLAYVGTVALVPGMVFAAVLGARTYRAPRGVAGRVGAGVGALIGFSGLLSLVWVAAALGFAERDQAFRSGTFADVGGIAFYLFPPLTLAGAILVVMSLYAKGMDTPRRWRLGLVGAGLAVLAGFGLVLSDPGTVGIAAVLISAVSAALAGWVGGAGGYARAGGDEMIPPGSTIRPRGPRQKPR